MKRKIEIEVGNMDNKEHLPLYGVGPVITFGQIIFTVLSRIAAHHLGLDRLQIDFLDVPLDIIGILLIILGVWLDISAKYKSKLFKNVEENKLITDGVYGIVRNPVYGGVLLACTGAVLIINIYVLFVVPFICWGYVTIFLINTEEKWLNDMYGQEYAEYCERVNRCIPWFPKKK